MVGHVLTYQQFISSTAAVKTIQENKVVWSNALHYPAQSPTIPGTRKLHSFVPLSDSTVQMKHYSTSDISRKERVSLAKSDIPPESIAGFVTCSCDGNWWLACVLEVCSDTKAVKLTFLHPHGPANSFKYPTPHNIRTMHRYGLY